MTTVLNKSNEELFDFSDVDPEVEEILEQEEAEKRYVTEYCDQFSNMLNDELVPGSDVFNLVEYFDTKYSHIPAYEMLIRAATLEMRAYGVSINEMYNILNSAISGMLGSDESEDVE